MLALGNKTFTVKSYTTYDIVNTQTKEKYTFKQISPSSIPLTVYTLVKKYNWFPHITIKAPKNKAYMCGLFSNQIMAHGNPDSGTFTITYQTYTFEVTEPGMGPEILVGSLWWE